MTFSLKIKLGNAAMQEGRDVADALREVADRIGDYGTIEDGDLHGKVYDLNGNSVGAWEVSA